MIKYISNESSFNKNFIEQNSNINYYGLSSYNLYDSWQYFSPTNMNNFISDDGKFKVYFQSQDNDLKIWRAFNHNQEIDLGMFSNNIRSKNIYFQFNQKKCLKALKVNLYNIKRTFNLKLQASINKNSWIDIDTYKIGSFNNNSLNESLLFINKDGGDYFNGNPVLICKFHNNKKYKYYRLSFSTSNYYDFGIKIAKMFLYDDDGVKSNFLYFPFNKNIKDFNNQINGESYNINFNNNSCVFNKTSYIKYNSSSLCNIGNCSINFKANLFGDNLKGTLISKGYCNYYYDKGYTFNFKCEQFDLINKPPLTFTALQDNSTICFCNQYYDKIIGNVFYSVDNGQNWIRYQMKNISNQEKQIITLNTNQNIMFLNIEKDLSQMCYFQLTGKFNLSGDLRSLLGYENAMKHNEQFYGLFQNNDAIIDASKLKLSFLSLTYQCYAYMFSGCINLTKSPEICNVQSYNSYSYYRMFENCKNLIQIHTRFEVWHGGFNNWVRGVSSQGTFIKSSNLNQIRGVSNIPEGWQIIDINDYDEEDDNEIIAWDIVVFTVDTKFYNYSVIVNLNEVKNNFHLYSFVFGKNEDRFYIDAKQKFNYKYEENSENKVFNSGMIMPLTLGCESYDIDYYENTYELKNHITNMELKQLSFYDYELSQSQIRNIMNKQ